MFNHGQRRDLMKRIAFVVLAVGASICLIAVVPGPASAADVPSDRVLVMYFHRTQRCPTCLKMGSYSEEAVKGGFAPQIKQGLVAFHYIDFQDKKNAALTKAYRISGPTLIVAKVVGNKVTGIRNLEDIWSKVADEPAFFQYVQENVAALLPPADRVVAMYFHRTQRCPTCLKMGGYSEEAVKSRFAEQLKDGTVAFYYVDFQDKRNAALTKDYGVSGPALIVARIVDNKVVNFTNLEDIWTKAGDKEAFVKYVQENIAAHHKQVLQKLAGERETLKNPIR